MGIEIERRFFVKPEWRQGAYMMNSPDIILQGYLAPGIRVRLINSNESVITIKGDGVISRPEYEYKIPYSDGIEIIKMCKSSIHKTRYQVLHRKNIWYIDEFLGDNYGLVLAEIELKSEDQEFEKPDWLWEETSISNYDLSILPWIYR